MIMTVEEPVTKTYFGQGQLYILNGTFLENKLSDQGQECELGYGAAKQAFSNNKRFPDCLQYLIMRHS